MSALSATPLQQNQAMNLAPSPVQMKAERPAQAEETDQPELADPLRDPLQRLSLGGGGGGGGGESPAAPPPDDTGPRGFSLVQMLALSPMLQFMGGGGGQGVQRAAAAGLSGSGGALPFADRIQSSFGKHDVSGVKAHTGAKASDAASAMGARAFASGSDVAFAGTPDLHTAAHEAAHTVQQQGGVQLKDGVGRAGDRYEQNADAVADAVVQGKSAEGLLDPFAGSGGSGGVQLDEEEGGSKLPDVKLANSTELAFAINVPVLPGFAVHAEVTAELGKETKLGAGLFNQEDGHNKATTSTIKLNVKMGGEFTVLFFKIGVGLFGQIEAEVEGDKNPLALVQAAARESIRFFAADKVEGTANKLKAIGGLVTKNEQEVNGIINPLIAKIIMDSDYTESNKSTIKEELTTENHWLNPFSTALEKIKSRRKSFQSELSSACDLPGEEAERAAGIVVPFDGVIGEMNKMGAAMTGEGPAAAKAARSALNAGRENIIRIMGSAAKSAQDTVNQLDFMVPTPGVKVKGQLGGYAYAKFAWGASDSSEAEGEIAAGVQYDTSKTKKENVDMGDGTYKERDVFDKAAGVQGIVKLKGKVALAGWGAELELTGAWNSTDHDYAAAFEGNTPSLPLFIQPGDLTKVLTVAAGNSRRIFAPVSAEQPRSEEESKGILTKVKEKISAWYEAIQPEIALAKLATSIPNRAKKVQTGSGFDVPLPFGIKEKASALGKDLAEKSDLEVKEKPEAGTSRVVVGGTLELHRKLGQWTIGGEVHLGTMNETKVEAFGMAEASMKQKEVIKAQWDA